MNQITPDAFDHVDDLSTAYFEMQRTLCCDDRAFPRELANAARAILWRATGCDPDDPATWTLPVIRLGTFTQSPFIEAANTPRLHAAFNQLVGRGSLAST
jgi:hypothetical protein